MKKEALLTTERIQRSRVSKASALTGNGERLPFVSIVIPVYNAARTIDECLESLMKLNYPEDRHEIIFVDNGSIDDTYNRIKKYHVFLESECNIQSSYAARNKGIARSRGEIIAFTDGDCVLEPQWILKGVECFEDASCGAVAGKISSMVPRTIIEQYLETIHFLSERHVLDHPFYPYVQTANAFYRRAVFDEIGLFDPTLVSGGDADLAWRMQMGTAYHICHAPEAEVLHRHRTSLKGLYKQKKNHWIGKTILESKYEDHMVEMGVLQRKDRYHVKLLRDFLLHVGFLFSKFIMELLCFRPSRCLDGFFCFVGFLGESAGRRSVKK